MRFDTEKKKTFLLPGILAAVLILGILALAAYLLDRSSDTPPSPSGGKTVEEMLGTEGAEAPVQYGGKWYARNPDVEAFLLMGVDRTGEVASMEGYGNGGQSDLMLLLVVDDQNQRYSILQINRDTMTTVEILGMVGDVVGTETLQIALAHGYGDGLEESCENAVRAVSNLLYGMEIDGYAAIQMDAIPILNDMVGGVTVTIEDDFSQMDPTLTQGATTTLTGEQAMNFVRARSYVGDSSNLSRMARHRTYLSAFGQQFQRAADEDPNLVINMYDAIQPYMVTDMGSKTVTQIAERCRGYESQGTITVDGEARQGEIYMEYYVDEDSLMQTILRLFYLETHENTGG